MEHQNDWVRLRHELRGRGLPEAYIERLLGELNDHVEDLVQERNSAMRHPGSVSQGSELRIVGKDGLLDIDERLGSVTEIAGVTTAEFRRRTVVGRHPIFSFLIGPPLLLVLGWIAMIYLGLFLGDLAPRIARMLPVSREALVTPAMVACYAYMPILSLVPPLVTVLGLVWLARRAGVSWRWPVAACLWVAFLAGAFVAQVNVVLEPGHSSLQLGMGLPMRGLQPLQALLVLLIGSLAVRRHFPLFRPPAETAPDRGVSGEVQRLAA